MPKNLIYYLEKIPDFREPRGCRHRLPVVLLITILAIMSGELGYQAMSRFLERHRRNLSFVTRSVHIPYLREHQ
ncbi:MAG: DDE transposase family protein [Microcystis wesenbergii TW10]|jgi:hypothetical protein|uniref:DDE transposase family protein n=2 Tax=Microcystis TaxID=1125 RepID=A0A552AJI0_MICAE|nr:MULTISPECIES: transposase family protein [Microcystis]MCZ8039247.1 transposase family protein [Microcystis sp. LE17-20A]MCZ8213433.1 transposase family protein [Microcystis sp. LE19-8.1F]REJ53154.1 MAG: DDE transposase family protein [Microcystis wesenbergii TW10]TRT85602.1 MAG: DDE transposase family protein [Microcystis aeruginosa Ma_OC_H_19870700_S124]